MVFRSCDIVLQQVRIQHFTVCCSWILHDECRRGMCVCMPGSIVAARQLACNFSHRLVFPFLTWSHLSTTLRLLQLKLSVKVRALQHPWVSPHILPSPIAGPRYQQGQSVAVLCSSMLMLFLGRVFFWNRLAFVSSCVVFWHVDKSFCLPPDLGPEQ